MREIRPYGSEGGVALTTPLLPLSGTRHSPSRANNFGACYLAGTAGHARRFNNKTKKESK